MFENRYNISLNPPGVANPLFTTQILSCSLCYIQYMLTLLLLIMTTCSSSYFLMYLLGALLVTRGSKSSSRYHEGDDKMGRALSNNTVNLCRGGF